MYAVLLISALGSALAQGSDAGPDAPDASTAPAGEETTPVAEDATPPGVLRPTSAPPPVIVPQLQVGPAPAGLPPARGVPPGMTPEKLHALRSYKAQRLSVRAETEISGGGYSSLGYGYSVGPGHVLRHEMVVPEPVYTTRTWGVYRGPYRLPVSVFYATVGDETRRLALDADIQKSRRQARSWFTVAGVGAAGILVGVAGMSVAETPEQWAAFSRVSFGGSLVSITGLLGGSFPSSRASRLQRHPSETIEPTQAGKLIDTHNEELRIQLGLSAEEVWMLEIASDTP